MKNKKLNQKEGDRTILKESKIIKDKAKQKIDNMVNELNDIEFLNILKKKKIIKKKKEKNKNKKKT